MRGALELVGKRRIVEARTLVRCILENLFWAAGFAEDHDKFRQAMLDDDQNRKGLAGQTLFKTGELPDEIEQKLRRWMRENKGWNKLKSIAPNQVAEGTQVGDAYVFYNALSLDAHPTIQALNRYVVSKDGKDITGIDLDPEASEAELVETVSLGCYGLVTVLACGCKILRSDASEKVDLLAREYLEMMKAVAEANEARGASSFTV